MGSSQWCEKCEVEKAIGDYWKFSFSYRIVKTVMQCNMRFYLEVSLLQASSMKIRV